MFTSPLSATTDAHGGALPRRRWLAAAGLLALPGLALAAEADADGAAWQALRDGAILLVRHAQAPGVGDPPGFRLGDCATQRNLDATGRAQARRLGERLRAQRVMVGAVWSSRWCRTRETAELAAVGPVREVAAFDSTFGGRDPDGRQAAQARALLLGWRGPGSLVVVTHQVNISALTAGGAASGEGVVLVRDGDGLRVLGRIGP
jgi:phosphohistidine phosphatase SixA